MEVRIVRSKEGWQVYQPKQSTQTLEKIACEAGYRVGEICLRLACDERYFRRVFSRDVGLSPKEWLRGERMVMAQRQLQLGIHESETAESLGFSGRDSFRREFVAIHGVTPSQWLARAVSPLA